MSKHLESCIRSVLGVGQTVQLNVEHVSDILRSAKKTKELRELLISEATEARRFKPTTLVAGLPNGGYGQNKGLFAALVPIWKRPTVFAGIWGKKCEKGWAWWCLVTDRRHEQGLSLEAQAGGVLLSCMVESGFCHSPSTEHFKSRISQGPGSAQGIPYVEFATRKDGQGDVARLFLRSGTISRLASLGDSLSVTLESHSWLELVQAYIDEAGEPSAVAAPTSLSELFGAVAAFLRIRVPGVMVKYATDLRCVRGLDYPTRWRFGDESCEKLDRERARDRNAAAEIASPVRRNASKQSADWLSIREALSARSVGAARRRLERIVDHLDEGDRTLRAAIAWLALDYLQGDRKSKRKVRLITVKRYVSWLYYWFSACNRGIDGLRCTEKEISIAVRSLFGSSLARESKRWGRERLKSLIVCLQKVDGWFVDSSLINECAERIQDIPVSGKLLSYGDYLDAHQLLKSESHYESRPVYGTMQRIALILGYRCGLRNDEILGLLIDDIDLEGEAMLRVERNEFRPLKTRAARRQIPLLPLLSGDEWSALKKFVAARREQEADTRFSRLLFAVPEDLRPKMTHRRIVYPVIQALRAVTGDDSFRFHDLRHTAASVLAVRLMRHDLGRNVLNHPLLAWMPPESSVRPLSDLLDGDIVGREGLAMLAVILGHAGGATTLRHYIHVMDVLLYLALDDAEIWDAKDVGSFRLNESDEVNTALESKWDIGERAETYILRQALVGSQVDMVWRVSNLVERHGYTMADVARKMGRGEEEIRGVYSLATKHEWVRAIGHGTLGARLTTVVRDDRRSGACRSYHVPAYPHGNRRLYRRLVAEIESWIADDPASYREFVETLVAQRVKDSPWFICLRDESVNGACAITQGLIRMGLRGKELRFSAERPARSGKQRRASMRESAERVSQRVAGGPGRGECRVDDELRYVKVSYGPQGNTPYEFWLALYLGAVWATWCDRQLLEDNRTS